jgi:hypothetical protein
MPVCKGHVTAVGPKRDLVASGTLRYRAALSDQMRGGGLAS